MSVNDIPELAKPEKSNQTARPELPQTQSVSDSGRKS
jgi:hypothetical protein